MIDSTQRASFKACDHKFYWEWLRRLTLCEQSPDLLAGGAFARALEVARRCFYADGVSAHDSEAEGALALIEFFGDYEPPENNPKTCERMLGALTYYFDCYPLETDIIQPLRTPNGPAVEITFALPIPGTKHPETGEEVLYGGRFDMIGLHTGFDALYVVDEKTTKQLGYTWAEKWSMRGQFLGYMWAAQSHGHPVAGSIVRGISILKTKYGHAEAIVGMQQWMLDQYIEQLADDVRRMISSWERNYWGKCFDESCNSYNGCPMKRLCLSREPELWTSQLYRRNTWNPLKKNPEEE